MALGRRDCDAAIAAQLVSSASIANGLRLLDGMAAMATDHELDVDIAEFAALGRHLAAVRVCRYQPIGPKPARSERRRFGWLSPGGLDGVLSGARLVAHAEGPGSCTTHRTKTGRCTAFLAQRRAVSKTASGQNEKRASTKRVVTCAANLAVGRTGLEPVTSCVSCKRASQLRQRPVWTGFRACLKSEFIRCPARAFLGPKYSVVPTALPIHRYPSITSGTR